jgi:hypothetical protein
MLNDTTGYTGLPDDRIMPQYDGHCVSSLPAIAASALDVSSRCPAPDGVVSSLSGDVDCVVLLVVDGLGLDCWQRDRAKHDFLQRLHESGSVTSLTSTFPSATAAAMTSIHTGVPPGQHGVLGWSQYQPSIDRVVEPITHQFRGGKPGDASQAVAPEAVVTAEPAYPELERRGVSTHVLQQSATLGTHYADRTLDGATTHPYSALDDMARTLRRTIETTDRPAYICVHVLDLDAVAHTHGTTAAEYQSVLSTLSAALERELLGSDALDHTTLLLAADHGHVDTNPAKTVTLLDDPVVTDRLATREDGTRIDPVGGPRNAHLHLQPGTVSTVETHLQDRYGLDVIRGTRLVSDGWYGSTTDAVRGRCGELVVGHPDHSVWHGTDGAADRIGQHGWLTPREMLVPLVAVHCGTLTT